MMPMLLVGSHTLKTIILGNYFVPKKGEWNLRIWCQRGRDSNCLLYEIGQNLKNLRDPMMDRPQGRAA